MGQTLLASVLMAAGMLIGIYASLHSGTPPLGVAAWALMVVLGQTTMVLAIRFGWSLRFDDPSLTLPQIAFSLTYTCTLYPWAGEYRAAALPILIVALAFGMFQLHARAVLGLSAYTLALMGGTMFYGVALGPQQHAAHVELGHYFMMFFSVVGVGIMSVRMSTIRQRLRSQRQELQLALERIEALARRDALTGAFNRGHAEEVLQRELKRHGRSKAPLCVVMLDLDHFKRVNDLHGHAAGDAVLVAFSKTVQAQLRDTDTLARWGGEEFLLLLEDASVEGAMVVMQRVQAAVRQLTVPLPDQNLSCRFSAGLACFEPGDTAPALLLRADKALYRAKAEGRDRVVQG
jgi:diguanylate cyclase (GGDEF)-like protein